MKCLVALIFINCSLIVAVPSPPISEQVHPMYRRKEISSRTKRNHGINPWYRTSKILTIPATIVYKWNNFDDTTDKSVVTKSSNFKSAWNSFSLTSENPRTTISKEENRISPFVVVAIVLSGIVGLYLVYLLLLLSVVCWTYILQRFNMYKYVEVVE